MAADLPSICYLCGQPLCQPIDRDHVPPKQIFAQSIRKAHAPNLLTIPVHAACNKSYQLDEEYFLHTLAPFGLKSYAGKAVLDEVLAKFRDGRNVPLNTKVLNEFDRRHPSGLILPGKVIKHFEGERLWRIVLKIVRGLYFHHYAEYLPAELTASMDISPPDERPPEHFLVALTNRNQPKHGLYPGVFDYSFTKFPEVNNFHYWALLLWDQIIFTVMFHDPACDCSECAPAAATA